MLYIMLAAAYPFGRPEDENLKPAKKMHVMLQVLVCPLPCPTLLCPAHAHTMALSLPLPPPCSALTFFLLAFGDPAPALAASPGLACPAAFPVPAAFPAPALAVSPAWLSTNALWYLGCPVLHAPSDPERCLCPAFLAMTLGLSGDDLMAFWPRP